MSVPNLNPDMTLRDAALVTAEYVFDLEADTVQHDSHNLSRWQSLPAYDDPLSLFSYGGEGEPNITFRIGGDMPDELVVFTQTQEDLRLKNDVYVQFFFDRYLGIVDGHEHEICTRIITRMIEQQHKKEELFDALEERNRATGASFETTTKDVMRSDYAQGKILSWLQQKD
jgi:hypothetical protein